MDRQIGTLYGVPVVMVDRLDHEPPMTIWFETWKPLFSRMTPEMLGDAITGLPDDEADKLIAWWNENNIYRGTPHDFGPQTRESL